MELIGKTHFFRDVVFGRSNDEFPLFKIVGDPIRDTSN